MAWQNYLGPLGWGYNKITGKDTGDASQYFDPGDLFNKQSGKAVQEAGKAAQAYLQQLSDTSWNRQMSGLQRALSSMNNYNDVLSNLYGVKTNHYDPNAPNDLAGGYGPPADPSQADPNAVPRDTTPVSTLPSRGANSTSPSSMEPSGPQTLATRVPTGTQSESPSGPQTLPGRGATGAGVASSTPPIVPASVQSGAPGGGYGIDPNAILSILGQMAVAPSTGPAMSTRSGRGHF